MQHIRGARLFLSFSSFSPANDFSLIRFYSSTVELFTRLSPEQSKTRRKNLGNPFNCDETWFKQSPTNELLRSNELPRVEYRRTNKNTTRGFNTSVPASSRGFPRQKGSSPTATSSRRLFLADIAWLVLDTVWGHPSYDYGPRDVNIRRTIKNKAAFRHKYR